MAVIVNKNTTQASLGSGLTGSQVIKFIPGPRMYVKAVDTTATPVVAKSNGSTPAGWTDLGTVEGNARLAYDKEVKQVRTGIDQVLRASYIGQKSASVEVVLNQFDDKMFAEVSGITPSLISNASIYQFTTGSEDIVQRAVLLVLQNKLDGKEWQLYHPSADISFQIEDANEAMVVRMRCEFKAFTFGSVEPLFVQSIFA
jgi:hypothetical protein